MILGIDMHCFNIHNDGYFSHLSLTYVDGVILEMAVGRMPYEEFAMYLEEKCGCYFQEGAETSTRNIDKGIDATDYVKARTSTTNKGKENVSEDATKVVETRRSIVEIDSETEIKANRDAKAKAKDNLVLETNKPNNENNMPVDNVKGETFEEYDIYMNELLKSLNTTDKDGITEDPFISVEKHVERSGEVRVVAKCGQRLPRLSDPEKEYEKTNGEHYSMHRSYGKAILDSNPGSTVKLGVTVNPDGKTYFDRFYVCFARLANGWKAGYRKIIALDGCFLKSPNQGEILTIIRRDRNNHIYLVAWAMSMYSTILPPKPRKMPSRPRKKRLRSMGEGGSSTRVSKIAGQANCLNCKKPGHNKASCKEPVVEQTSKHRGVVGRPRNKQLVEDLEDVDVVYRCPVRDEGAGGLEEVRGSRGRGGLVGSRVVLVGLKVVPVFQEELLVGLEEVLVCLVVLVGQQVEELVGLVVLVGQEVEVLVGLVVLVGQETQDEPQQTHHESMQTQDEDYVEKTQKQAEIDLTQVEQTQEQTQDQ
nr:multidrug resistance-associated protein 5 [Tanacetum cinerariifolium]